MLTFISSEVKPYMAAFSFDHMGTTEIASALFSPPGESKLQIMNANSDTMTPSGCSKQLHVTGNNYDMHWYPKSFLLRVEKFQMTVSCSFLCY